MAERTLRRPRATPDTLDALLLPAHMPRHLDPDVTLILTSRQDD